jgi:hypothetical protein
MDIKFKPPGGTVGLNPITGDAIVDWDKYFAQNFNNIDNFIGAMAKNWPTIGVTAGLVVTAGTGMTVSVSPGGAVIQGHFFSLDAAQTLTVLPADPTYNRIDLVVVHLNWATGNMNLSIVKGTAASIYAAAQVTTNDTVWEIPLAEIVVNTGVSSITSANITDKRFFTAKDILSGSNSSGNYVMFPDGTLIQWFNVTYIANAIVWSTAPQAGSTYYYTSTSWNYPMQFVNTAPISVHASGDIPTFGIEQHKAYNPNTTFCKTEQGVLGIDPVTMGATTCFKSLFAIGRWK